MHLVTPGFTLHVRRSETVRLSIEHARVSFVGIGTAWRPAARLLPGQERPVCGPPRDAGPGFPRLGLPEIGGHGRGTPERRPNKSGEGGTCDNLTGTRAHKR